MVMQRWRRRRRVRVRVRIDPDHAEPRVGLAERAHRAGGDRVIAAEREGEAAERGGACDGLVHELKPATDQRPVDDLRRRARARLADGRVAVCAAAVLRAVVVGPCGEIDGHAAVLPLAVSFHGLVVLIERQARAQPALAVPRVKIEVARVVHRPPELCERRSEAGGAECGGRGVGTSKVLTLAERRADHVHVAACEPRESRRLAMGALRGRRHDV
mmetsp:Transcript_5817/g.18306  ORF Transcript_5817/g.18306 Transcript_5817/m.18306 type:complete len:216 (-) Transcript_5817:4-651(-)